MYEIFKGSEVVDMEGNWKEKEGIHSCDMISNYRLKCDGEPIKILNNNKLRMLNHKTTGNYDGNHQIKWSNGSNWTKDGITILNIFRLISPVS